MGWQSFDELREAMTRDQIERRGVTDPRVLDAMRTVPRERFVPPGSAHEAYADRALGIGVGQTISQPYMVAVMTQALSVAAGDRVLEVGTGSGYQCAVLAALAGSVVSIERHASLASEARARLDALGITNATIVVGDGTDGYPDRAPFDGILVTAGAPHVPGALREQLAEGGRLVIPVGTEWRQDLVVLRREGSQFHETVLDGCMFVPLIGRDGWKG